MRQHYPTYSYADTGELVRVLFEKEITLERLELRAVNEKAQKFLSPDASEVTVASSGIIGDAVIRGLNTIIPNLTESRLANIDTLMKQKATIRHYALFALYFVSLVALKLDDRYALLDRIFGLPQDQAQIVAMVPRRPVTTQVVQVMQAAQQAPVTVAQAPVQPVTAAPVASQMVTRGIASLPAQTGNTQTTARANSNARTNRYARAYKKHKS